MKPNNNHNQTPSLSHKHQRLFDEMAMIINEEFIDSGQILDGELLYQLFIAIKDMLEEKR